ncbi:hypothetical protein EDD21DRAFT_393354 [Dissophora ornata]|nr:hypothetical protein EDD21DRAFT_393354 [Dissophora ornata]
MVEALFLYRLSAPPLSCVHADMVDQQVLRTWIIVWLLTTGTPAVKCAIGHVRVIVYFVFVCERVKQINHVITFVSFCFVFCHNGFEGTQIRPCLPGIR